MPYRYKTQYYRIPVMGEGDLLTEEQEWAQMSTIDNLLHAAMFGCTRAYLEEGTYSIEWSENHKECHLVIKPAKQGGYSLLGIINGRLFKSMDDISVGTLYWDTIYHVYVESSEGLETDSRCFSVRAYTEKMEESRFRMKLCVVDTHGDGTVNTDVDKIYAKNLLAHTMDTTNPHGRTQTQDALKVVESLEVRGSEVHGVEVRRAVTGGEAGTVVEFPSEPLFATVCPDALGAGDFACQIVGNKVVVFNSGAKGIGILVRADMK